MSWFTKSSASLPTNPTDVKDPRLGTFMGVFVPTILMLFGVIIFLRMGWIVGQVGLPISLFIITLSALIAFLTILSMAAIATNIEVGKGGVYYILSRSLGLHAGCALGFPLYFKQTLSIAFCIVGFAESLHDLIPSWSITSISIWTLIGLTVFALKSLKGALLLQVAIFIMLFASFVSFFTGGALTPPDPDMFIPAPVRNLGFWAIFAIFFPAMTGIESSVSLSGDLKNPSKSLPLGTITGLLVAYGVYIAISIFLAKYVPLDRLASDPLIMQDLASIPSLIIVGIWGATLSSALGGILGAPRTLQAMADDGVAPGIFSKTYGAGQEPRGAMLATFILALFSIYFGSVNLIAPLLTMICLICYAVLNLSAGLEIFMENPSWRPRFRLHWVVPISGAILSFIIMLMIDAGTAIISLLLVAIIYLIAKYRQINESMDGIHQGFLQFLSRFAIYKLAYAEEGTKSWRPNFLVFTTQNETSNSILNFSQAISKNKGFLTMASVLPIPATGKQPIRDLEKIITKQLQAQNIQALVQINYADKVEEGMYGIIENYGLGPLTPNTVLFGGIPKGEKGIDFAKVIQTAFQRHYNIIILNDSNNIIPAEQLPAKDKGNIHVWWDETDQANGEFMLVLSYMLQRNPLFKKANICLKSLVSNEINRQKKITDFQTFAAKNRLRFETEVLVCNNPETEFNNLLHSFSRDAGIIFLSLRKPHIDETTESYNNYLQEMSKLSGALPSVALVISSETTSLKNFFK